MKVRQISIGGNRIGLVDIDEIFEQVRALGISDPEELKRMLLEKVKAGNYVPPKLEKVYMEDLLDEYRVFIGEQCRRRRAEGLVEVRVYGQGCPTCERLDRMAMEVIANKGLRVDYQYVTEAGEIRAAGVIGTPALTIDGKVAFLGRVPSAGEMERVLMRAVMKEDGG